MTDMTRDVRIITRHDEFIIKPNIPGPFPANTVIKRRVLQPLRIIPCRGMIYDPPPAPLIGFWSLVCTSLALILSFFLPSFLTLYLILFCRKPLRGSTLQCPAQSYP